MGAWGHQPKDNDGAWDIADTALHKAEAWLAGEYAKLVPRRKERMTRVGRGTREEAWRRVEAADARFVRAGAVQILLERGVFVRRALVEQAVADLDAALADESYLKGWRNPRLARHGTARIHAAMRTLLKQGYWRKGRRFRSVRIGPKEWKRARGWKFHPAPGILAPFGWPAKDAGRRSWTGVELHRLGRAAKAKRP